jgi:hypothetical protein
MLEEQSKEHVDRPVPKALLQSQDQDMKSRESAWSGWFRKWRVSRRQEKLLSGESLATAVHIREVRALIHWVTDRAIDSSATVTVPLNKILHAYEAEVDSNKKADLESEILNLYSQLTALTYPKNEVNGWTILGTERVGRHIWLTILWGVVFFLLAAVTQILGNWYAQSQPPTAGFAYGLYLFHQLALVYLFPFFWGGLGASIFLVKRLGDKAAASSFNSRLLCGQSARVFLGSILGAVVVHLFYTNVEQFSSGFRSVGPSGVAFLTGLSTKAIYAALEKVVDTLSDAIQSIGQPKETEGKKP